MIGQCLVCECRTELRREFCAACWTSLSSQLYSRHHPPRMLHGLALVSAGPYTSTLKEYLLRLKRQTLPGLATEAFLEELLGYWAPELAIFDANALVAVPRSFLSSRLGVDLPRNLALTLSRQLKIPLLHPCPRKNFWHDLLHGPQKLKDLENRVRHPPRFDVEKGTRPRRARILLVDDLCSTGASLRALRRAVEDAGHRCVGAFCLVDNDAPPLERDKRTRVPGQQDRSREGRGFAPKRRFHVAHQEVTLQP